MNSLSGAIDDLISEISTRREQIKEDFIKAWLATLPLNHLQVDWIIQHVELVEERHFDNGKSSISWFLRVRN